jgi:Alcohol dehydrogenase transcription factor Myb/SANT-like.
MIKDFWTQDNVISLIQLYESHRLLWDTNEPNYKNKYKRKDSYDSISTELGVNNTEEVKKKLKAS